MQTTESLSYIVGELLGLPRYRRSGKAYEIVKAVLKAIVIGLEKDRVVLIPGFGTFKLKTIKPTYRTHYYFKGGKGRKGKYGRDEKDRPWERVLMPERKTVIFIPWKDLEEGDFNES